MQNLLDGQKDTDDIYDVLEEPKDHKKLLLVTFIVAIVAILAFSLYYFISAAPQQQATERRQALQNIPLLKPSGALKKIPENAGGLNIPHQDKKVFETIEPSPEPSPSPPSPEPEPSPPTPETSPQPEADDTETDDTTTVLPPPETPVTPEPSPEPAQEPSPEPSPEPAGRLQIDIFAPPSPEPSPEPAPEPAPSSEEQGEELPEAREEQQEQGQQEGESNSDKLEIIIPPIPQPEPAPEPSPPAEEQGELPQAEEEQETGQQEQGGQGGGFSVQFAALSDAASAEIIRNDILQRFSTILPTHRLPDGLIVAMDKLADGSDIFRVQMGNLDYNTAQEICRQTKQDNQDCFVKREANAEGGEEQGEGGEG